MALVGGSHRVTNPLDRALADFQSKLAPDERTRFELLSRTKPDAESVNALIAQLDLEGRSRSGRSVTARLLFLLKSIQQYSGIVDTFVQSGPQIASLIWGSVQLVLKLAINSFGFFDDLSTFLNKIGKLFPHFSAYESLYPNSLKLRLALQDFYASFIKCCSHSCEVLRRHDWKNYVRGAWKPFEAEFQPLQTEIEEHEKNVKDAIAFAKAEADVHKHQEDKEFRVFWRKQEKERSHMEQWQAKLSRQRQLVGQLSTYNRDIVLSRAYRERTNGTSEWLVVEQEFIAWSSADKSCVLWLSGKLGCGKTVLVSNAIGHICSRCTKSTLVTYFFCRFDEDSSLQSTNILRSIAQQCLSSAESIDDKIEIAIKKVLQAGPICEDELAELLHLIFSNSTVVSSFVIIDGIDECSDLERLRLFDTLNRVTELARAPQAPRSCVKFLFSGRNRPPKAVSSLSGSMYEVLISDDIVQDDIRTYVASELQQRKELGRLDINDSTLVPQIQNSLVAGAKGMFLWVALQLDEICRQDCDHDIREAINNLPKSLGEIYHNMLGRIGRHQSSVRARQILQWVLIAKRPLTLLELQEALAVERFAQYSQRERYVTDPSRLVTCCEGFLVLDEIIDSEIYLAHTTMRSSLIEYRAGGWTSFNLQDMDKEAAEVCVTYLNFNDFNARLMKHDAVKTIATDAVLASSLASVNLLSPKLQYPIRKVLRSRSPRAAINPFLGPTQITRRTGDATMPQYPFLAYASIHWLSHSYNLKKTDQIWPLWYSLFSDENNSKLAIKPWTARLGAGRDDPVSHYVIQHDHVALVRLLETKGLPGLQGLLSEEQRGKILQGAGELGKTKLFKELWARNKPPKDLQVPQYVSMREYYSPLSFAARSGYIEIVRALLGEGEDIHSSSRGEKDALWTASSQGYRAIVALLISAGADVNFQGPIGETALCTAARERRVGIITLLLESGAEINPHKSEYGSALQAASQGGSDLVVKLLLNAGADVNAHGGIGGSALYIASRLGHLQVVRLLLDAGADIEATGIPHRDALKAAANGYHLEVVELLQEAGAK